MFKEAINDLVATIKTVTGFTADSVVRGEPGKINQVKKNTCIVMPDFDSTESLSGDAGELAKSAKFVATCFVCCASEKKLSDAEDIALDLLEAVITKVEETEKLISMGGNQKYCKWETGRIEWHDRSASLTIISVDFSINLQL